MAVAAVIVGRSYANILTMVYSAGKIQDCDVFVIRPYYPFKSLRNRYLQMMPEKESCMIKAEFLVPCKNESEEWSGIVHAVDEISQRREAYEKIVFFPVNDKCCLQLNRHRDQFDDRFVFYGFGKMGRGDCEWLFDKSRQKQIAIGNGINVAVGGLYAIETLSVATYGGGVALYCQGAQKRFVSDRH